MVWVCVALLTGSALPTGAEGLEILVDAEERNPWTSLEFPERRRDFHFAVVADNTGDPRPGVFAGALEKLARLRPDFVLSVGDFVRGFDANGRIDDLSLVESDWRGIEAAVARLDVPFFWVPGNHDLASPEARELWVERFGRTWASFVVEDRLFVMLDTDDPPGTRGGGIGPKQERWLARVLSRHRDVEWTFVFLHRPLWLDDRAAWIPVERLLAGRPRTVFSGHRHVFSHVTIEGYDYFTLATTGGLSRLLGPADGTFDHVTWVAVPDGEPPRVSHLGLDGIFGANPVAEAQTAGTRED